MSDPFRRAIDLSSLIIRVLIFNKGSRSEIDEFDVSSFNVYQHIFILDVSVEYSTAVTVGYRFNDLIKIQILAKNRDNIYKKIKQK